MRENILIRFSDHSENVGIKQYSVEVSLPGKYNRHIIGASQVELTTEMLTAFEELFDILGIPQTINRSLDELEQEVVAEVKFTDSNGAHIPISGFAATAKMTLEAQVIRDGKIVPPEYPVIDE